MHDGDFLDVDSAQIGVPRGVTIGGAAGAAAPGPVGCRGP